jgi:hypothetical protein
VFEADVVCEDTTFNRQKEKQTKARLVKAPVDTEASPSTARLKSAKGLPSSNKTETKQWLLQQACSKQAPKLNDLNLVCQNFIQIGRSNIIPGCAR